MKLKTRAALPPYGAEGTYCEPNHLQGFASPYYTKSHLEWRKRVRAFMETHVLPITSDPNSKELKSWLENSYPKELHVKLYEAGIGGALWDAKYGGTRFPEWDYFHELILWEELYRDANPHVLAHLSIHSMALPPIINYGSERLKSLVLKDVIQGRKFISLAISEPTAGSDVANIKTTAVRQGDHYVVNGQKKWITGGHFADFFTTVVRTGGPGGGGLSLLLLSRDMPGIKIRRMKTMFDSCHGTTFIDLEDVRVPVANLIGEEGQAMKYTMVNFNHERFVLAVQALTSARTCLRESFREASTRRTFGKRLIEHQVIRFKLAEMTRTVEATQALAESVAFAFTSGVPDRDLGSQCALLKVHAAKALEYCAREAVQVFGGSGLVREGRGFLVERLCRDPPEKLIPGGSIEILEDLAVREAVKGKL